MLNNVFEILFKINKAFKSCHFRRKIGGRDLIKKRV